MPTQALIRFFSPLDTQALPLNVREATEGHKTGSVDFAEAVAYR